MAINMCIETSIGDHYNCAASETTYAGCVLDKYERNMSDDSDFYAIVWDEESQSIKSVYYASTRGWTYHNAVEIDATDEVKAKAHDYMVQATIRRLVDSWDANVEKGKRVRSLTTRGKAKGITGVVVALEPSQYSRWTTIAKVKVETPESPYCGRHVYIDRSKCEVIRTEPNLSEIQESAERIARQGARSYILSPGFLARAMV